MKKTEETNAKELQKEEAPIEKGPVGEVNEPIAEQPKAEAAVPETTDKGPETPALEQADDPRY